MKKRVGSAKLNRSEVKETAQEWVGEMAERQRKQRGKWTTDLVKASGARVVGDADETSRDILARLRSGRSAEVGRLPVLRFLGRDSGCNSLPRPRCSDSETLSAAPGRREHDGQWALGLEGHPGGAIEGHVRTIFVMMPAIRRGHTWRRERRSERLRLTWWW